jgi:hypothetical protein
LSKDDWRNIPPPPQPWLWRISALLPGKFAQFLRGNSALLFWCNPQSCHHLEHDVFDRKNTLHYDCRTNLVKSRAFQTFRFICTLYSVHHRVGRVLSFLSSRGNWDSPNSDEGTYTVVLFIYTYFLMYTYVHLYIKSVGTACLVADCLISRSFQKFTQCIAASFN